MTKLDDAQSDIVDAALAQWWQGDCVLSGEHWFVHRVSESDNQQSDLRESQVAGFVVVTQTCDVRRLSRNRPYIAIAPLVSVREADFRLIQQGHRPNYAYIPGVSGQLLVADLDRIMTIDKSIVATWDRTPGCRTDSERRNLAVAVARKYSRFAFPDDFTKFMERLRARLHDKHDKNSSEGEALRAFLQIRVRASPDWDAPEVELMFWFIRDDALTPIKNNEALDKWLGLVKSSGRFTKVYGQIVTFSELTAADYLESDPLDLDQLSVVVPI